MPHRSARPSAAHCAPYRFTSPAPDGTRSAETWPKRWRSTARIAASCSSVAASVTWPPSPLTADQRPPSCGSRPETPRPVPGPKQGHRCTGHSAADADRTQLARRQRAEAHGERSEVVDHEAALGTERALQRGDREDPVVVCHLHPVGGDRRGDADGHPGGLRMALVGKVGRRRCRRDVWGSRCSSVRISGRHANRPGTSKSSTRKAGSRPASSRSSGRRLSRRSRTGECVRAASAPARSLSARWR